MSECVRSNLTITLNFHVNWTWNRIQVCINVMNKNTYRIERLIWFIICWKYSQCLDWRKWRAKWLKSMNRSTMLTELQPNINWRELLCTVGKLLVAITSVIFYTSEFHRFDANQRNGTEKKLENKIYDIMMIENLQRLWKRQRAMV